MSLAPGTKLGPYVIEAAVGAGGMGAVYRALDTRLNRSVAIKVVAPTSAPIPRARERFEREARAIASLEHPHICPVYDVGDQDGVSFLVMQYLQGETLAEQLGRRPLPLHKRCRTAPTWPVRSMLRIMLWARKRARAVFLRGRQVDGRRGERGRSARPTCRAVRGALPTLRGADELRRGGRWEVRDGSRGGAARSANPGGDQLGGGAEAVGAEITHEGSTEVQRGFSHEVQFTGVAGGAEAPPCMHQHP